VRAFFAEARDLPPASAGEGWLIFALPCRTCRAPIRRDRRHERYPMCDDIHTTLAELRDKDVEVARDVSDPGWRLLATIRLPDGGKFPSTSCGIRRRCNPDRCAHLPP
jgi:hypothetical protein